jgi:hypothetical protein
MTRDPENKQERTVPKSEEASLLALFAAMADTTWRMFTPPALLVAGGLYVDVKYGTKPWLTIAGAVVGMALSILLVRQQLRKSS